MCIVNKCSFQHEGSISRYSYPANCTEAGIGLNTNEDGDERLLSLCTFIQEVGHKFSIEN